MCSLKQIIILIVLSVSVIGVTLFFLKDGKYGAGNKYGEPLFLSSYISAGRLHEGRRLSRVMLPSFLNVPSYSGFLTINETMNSNMFFWYFPSTSNSSDPVLLWLQGGPGVSSLYGLFFEHGPFQIKEDRLEPRQIYWNKNHHVIYLDNPVGTGFSFTNGTPVENQEDVGRDLYLALDQFFKLFPGLRDNEFYVSGESYAGKFVCAVCYKIHQENRVTKNKINLKGFAIGNGWVDPINQIDYAPYFYELGLIDRKGLELYSTYQTKLISLIKESEWDSSMKYLNSWFLNFTHFEYVYDLLLEKSNDTEVNSLMKFTQEPMYRRALHVGNVSTFFYIAYEVMYYLREDSFQSVAGLLEELLDNYRGVIYSGQLDLVVPYTCTANYLRKLNFSATSYWKQAVRKPWYVEGKLAGYSKTAGHFTEVLVRNAGHSVPKYQPVWAENLIYKLTRNQSFSL